MATSLSCSADFVLGMDLGTTSVKVVLLEAKSNTVTDSRSFPTNSDISCTTDTRVGCEWLSKDEIIRFIPKDVSQLITWQDGRCSADFLSSLPKPDSHLSVATGFGCATIFWYMKHRPEFLSGFSDAGTIQDYVVSMLGGLDRCVMTGQNAASWGYFNKTTNQWNTQMAHIDLCSRYAPSMRTFAEPALVRAPQQTSSRQSKRRNVTKVRTRRKTVDLKDAGFPVHLLPVVVESGAVAGYTSSEWYGVPAHTPVGAALGDFQCSVYSCMTDKGDAVLNMSTSAQLTFGMPAEFSPPSSPDALSPVAYFPYLHGSYLAVAASLNGGNVMATFVRMLDSWIKEFGLEVNESRIYSQLIQSALAHPNTDLTVTSTLLGERHDPTTSASVSQISPSNLSLGHVTRAVCRGIIENMATMMPPHSLQAAGVRCIIGSGSALSCNPVLQQEVERVFPFPVVYGKDVDSAVGVAMVFKDQLMTFVSETPDLL
ncbi:Sedoheptulokinase [Anabarilius grahami]|uniref:Sedoheptulokinase n=1 Tax=Anabarilius grahami TaxID=495550 RepID=A0A3N0YYQ8_ANAGA|nr:Sedoheptulokinase [Anabarilius grahami]